MTRIDFYILQSEQISERLQFACKLLQQLLPQGRQCHIHCDDADSANNISDTLWAFSDTSFLAHDILEEKSSQTNPISISFTDNALCSHGDVLINLSTSKAPYFAQFDRLVEIVAGDELLRKQLRENYRFYQHRHYPLQNHQLQS